MSDTIVVTDGDDGNASPEFAAGVAAATAVTAAQTAVEADATAEHAEAVAEDAAGMAAAASNQAVTAEVTAEVALAAVADLEERVFTALGDLSAALTDEIDAAAATAAPDVVVSGDDNTVQVDDGDQGETDKPKRKPKKRQPFWTSRLS